MDRRKAEGACFYCGQSGHMANECPNKEVKINHVRLPEESPDSCEGEYEPDTDSTEELDGRGSIRTYKITVGLLRTGHSRQSNSLSTSMASPPDISKNNTFRSVRSVRLTHLTLELKSRIRTQPPYPTTHLTLPDAACNPQDAADAAPNTQDAT